MKSARARRGEKRALRGGKAADRPRNIVAWPLDRSEVAVAASPTDTDGTTPHVPESFSLSYGPGMRRAIAIEQPDGTLLSFDSGKPVTFARVADAKIWVAPGEKLKPIDVPDDWQDALVASSAY